MTGRARRSRGFTIIETVLATVVGALVLLGCVSVFLATNRAERAFSTRFERTSELWTTQLAMRRSFLQLLVDEQAPTPQAAQAQAEEYPRLLLSPDAGAPADASGYRPQRFELTLARSPVPSIVGSQVGSWLVENDRAQSLDFASSGLSSGAVRGVFEMRPAGDRELLMADLGLADPDPRLRRRMQTDPPPGWTLWWRPVLSAELADLQSGGPPRADRAGSADEQRARLAGAIPLITGVDWLEWQVFKSDQFVSEYAGTGIMDLPAYVQIELSLVNGQYASWMFEIGYATGDDPTDGASPDDEDTDPDAEEGQPRPGGGPGGRPGDPGGGPGGGQGGGRPGTGGAQYNTGPGRPGRPGGAQ